MFFVFIPARLKKTLQENHKTYIINNLTIEFRLLIDSCLLIYCQTILVRINILKSNFDKDARLRKNRWIAEICLLKIKEDVKIYADKF